MVSRYVHFIEIIPNLLANLLSLSYLILDLINGRFIGMLDAYEIINMIATVLYPNEISTSQSREGEVKVAGSMEMSDCDMVTMSLIGPSIHG